MSLCFLWSSYQSFEDSFPFLLWSLPETQSGSVLCLIYILTIILDSLFSYHLILNVLKFEKMLPIQLSLRSLMWGIIVHTFHIFERKQFILKILWFWNKDALLSFIMMLIWFYLESTDLFKMYTCTAEISQQLCHHSQDKGQHLLHSILGLWSSTASLLFQRYLPFVSSM